MLCPILNVRSTHDDSYIACKEKDCAWFLDHRGVCAIYGLGELYPELAGIVEAIQDLK